MTNQPPTLIGIDPAAVGKTGIVVATYTAAGKVDVLEYITVKGLTEICDWIIYAGEHYEPLAVFWEAGFMNTTKASDWIEALVAREFPDAIRRHYKDQVWRGGVFARAGVKGRKYWKATSLTWAKQTIPELKKGDHDIAEALGILCHGGDMLVKEGKITYLDVTI